LLIGNTARYQRVPLEQIHLDSRGAQLASIQLNAKVTTSFLPRRSRKITGRPSRSRLRRHRHGAGISACHTSLSRFRAKPLYGGDEKRSWRAIVSYAATPWRSISTLLQRWPSKPRTSRSHAPLAVRLRYVVLCAFCLLEGEESHGLTAHDSLFLLHDHGRESLKHIWRLQALTHRRAAFWPE
jgi:hypothetical protein